MRGHLNTHKITAPACLAGTAVIMIAALCVSLWLAWTILSAGNFFYPQLHELIDIQDTIAEYAPQNIYKSGLDQTTPEQRADLFRQILHGVNHNGEGLQSIQYSNAGGDSLGLLLRPAEVTHLRDVARLLASFRKVAYATLAILVVAVLVFRKRQLQLPRPTYLLAATAMAVLLAVLIISLTGAKQVFYRLHTVVFPSGHQWFFYYEESLMTLLMKAPDIFAWQAGMWVALAMLVYYVILLLAHFFLGFRNNAG